MRLLYTALVILVGAPFFVELNAQLSVGDLELPYGTHTVGYRHDTLYDASRTYETEGEWTNGRSPRPVPVSMWYPAVAAPPEAVPLRVMDYLRVLRDEGEWGSLPDSLILGWFEYADTPANRKGSQSFTHAYPDVNTHPGKFPVVVYAPGYMGSSTENFAVCELLASRGYMVLAAPGRGAGSISMRGTAARNAEGQARDVEFLLAYAKTLAGVRPGQVALMDYSFGGLATAAVAMRNADVKAVVSLDGRSRYDFRTLRASTSFDLAAFRAPLLHVAQKAIPAAVLEADGIDPKLNTDFTLYDTLSSNRAYSLRFHDLSHRHFSSYGLLLGREDPRQDRPAARVVAAYGVLARCVTDFLAASFRSDLAGTFTQRLKQEDQYPAAIVSIAHKAPALTFTFNDFNQQARDRIPGAEPRERARAEAAATASVAIQYSLTGKEVSGETRLFFRHLQHQLTLLLSGKQALEGLVEVFDAFVNVFLALEFSFHHPLAHFLSCGLVVLGVVHHDHALHSGAVHEQGEVIAGAFDVFFIVVLADGTTDNHPGVHP